MKLEWCKYIKKKNVFKLPADNLTPKKKQLNEAVRRRFAFVEKSNCNNSDSKLFYCNQLAYTDTKYC